MVNIFVTYSTVVLGSIPVGATQKTNKEPWGAAGLAKISSIKDGNIV